MYHRIAEVNSDHWELAVSPKNFEAHLKKVLQRYNVIPIGKLLDLLDVRENLNDSIVITFDDGYLDNYAEAQPILQAHLTPATFFITTGTIGSASEFWWDILDRICFSGPVPTERKLQTPCAIS